MARLCKHCGMESEQDRVCSWCGKPLETAAPTPAAGPAPAKAAAPAGGSSAAAPGRGKHAGAARALLAADRQRRETPVWPYYLIGVGVILVLILGGIFFVYWRALRPPVEPTEWKDVTSQTRLLALKVPGDWYYSTSGSPSQYEWVRVKSGLCRVDIEGSTTKGALGDIAGAAARTSAAHNEGSGPQPLEMRAEGRLHKTLGEFAAKNDPNFKDADDMQACWFAGMPAACSHYTTRKSAGLMSVGIKGLRITVPAGELSFDVRLSAPAKVWDKFEPTAYKIIESVTKGTG